MSSTYANYPDPHITVADYTDIEVGDLIRYANVDRSGRRIDEHDFVVTGVDTEPRDRVEGTPMSPGLHRLHVTVIKPPATSLAKRDVGDAVVEYDTTRLINGDDKLERADRRAVRALVEYVESLDPSGRQSL